MTDRNHTAIDRAAQHPRTSKSRSILRTVAFLAVALVAGVASINPALLSAQAETPSPPSAATPAATPAAAAPATPGPNGAGPIAFLHTLDNKPIEFTFRPDQTITPAVDDFHRTAQNAYSGDAAAIADGQAIYRKLCQACHLKDGTGRIGPNLTDHESRYPRTETPKGIFEIIYAGGAGAMQAFGKRIDQDDILKVMAYVETLKKK